MAVYGKYSLVEADTAAARQRHRVLIEKALREMDLTPEQRLELEWELKRALEQEFSATQDEDAESEDAKEKGGDGNAGHGGKSGGSGGGGGRAVPGQRSIGQRTRSQRC